MKRRAVAQGGKTRTVTTVIPKPEGGEEQAGKRAPENRAGGEVKHGAVLPKM
jgi:hypothetical protein